jgi:serine/threonine protein kinase
MALQIGDTVGDYEIVGVLGKGGMGKVYRVRNLLSDRIEAMKVVLPDLSADPGLADRFLREIRVHASLEHPHIAALRTALRVDNQVLMVMELVEGCSLEERLRQGALDIESGIRYVGQILSALDLAHSRGIIHRDIKPANVIVTPEGNVKLTDFGIARSASDASLTQSGVALGSLYYMSPEQVQAQPADRRSDIYALGVTFYEMVTGKRPIDGGSEYAILNAHLTHTPPAPVTLNPAVPIMLSAAIMKSLAKQPDERFQSAAEFREALRRVEGFTTMSSMVTEPVNRTRASTVPAIDPSRAQIEALSLTGSFSVIAPAIDPSRAQIEAASISVGETRPRPAIDPSRAQIEAALMKSLGPIAKILVSRTAPLCASAAELRDRLAAQIEDPQDRKAFLSQLSPGTAGGPSTASNGKPAVEVITQWDPVIIAKVKQQLAIYTGPIASVIVDRAAKKVRTPLDLYQALAAEIPSERDRAAFLKNAPWQG